MLFTGIYFPKVMTIYCQINTMAPSKWQIQSYLYITFWFFNQCLQGNKGWVLLHFFPRGSFSLPVHIHVNTLQLGCIGGRMERDKHGKWANARRESGSEHRSSSDNKLVRSEVYWVHTPLWRLERLNIHARACVWERECVYVCEHERMCLSERAMEREHERPQLSKHHHMPKSNFRFLLFHFHSCHQHQVSQVG